MEKELANFQWEFKLVADKTPNAFCLPGGKVVFYEGILPYTQTEAGIALSWAMKLLIW
jgi:predicted Zn-dependent protease